MRIRLMQMVLAVLVAGLLVACYQAPQESDSTETSLASERAAGGTASTAAPHSPMSMGAAGAISATVESDVPEEARLLFEQGQAMAAQGDTEQALARYEAAIEKYADFAAAHRAMGYLYFQMNRMDDAIHAYERAIEIKPDYAEAHTGLGMLYSSTGQGAKAAEHMRRAQELGRQGASPHDMRNMMQSVHQGVDMQGATPQEKPAPEGEM